MDIPRKILNPKRLRIMFEIWDPRGYWFWKPILDRTVGGYRIDWLNLNLEISWA